MSESKFEKIIVQSELEKEIKGKSSEMRDVLDGLERENMKGASAETTKISDEKISDKTELAKEEKEKSISGRVTTKRSYMDRYENIDRKTKSHGISDPRGRQNANNFDDIESSFGSVDINFDKLFTYLEGEKRVSNREKIKEFSEADDCIERLELLRIMPVSDAVRCLRDNSDNPKQYRYLANRLDFYQKLSQGRAIRTLSKGEYYNDRRLEKDMEVPIDSGDITPETVRLGILRDIMYAGMIGTPELAVYKIADKRLWASGARKTHMPKIRGYHSYIDQNSIGYAYPFLRDVYQRSRKIIEKKFEGQNVDEEKLEHKAVIQAANWLEEAMDYNDSDRGPESPYASMNIEESVAWARLGDIGVKAQLQGMRKKIRGVDLHNIGRFIGKSGPNKYNSERKRLYWQITNFDKLIAGSDDVFKQPDLPRYEYKLQNLEGAKEEGQITNEEFEAQKQELDKWFENNKTNFLIEENNNEIKKQTWWRVRALKKVSAKLEKELKGIEEANLPDGEKQPLLENIKDKYDKKTADIEKDCQERVEYFKNRAKEQFLEDLKKRQALIEKRYEKRKSLAQKALDLHFEFNHEQDSDSALNLVNWINYAPFGTIKRCHRMLKEGMNKEAIIEYAITDIICGKRGVTRDDLANVHVLFDKANLGDGDSGSKLDSMIKVGNIISSFGYEVTLDEVGELASKRFYGMTPALKEFSLEEVKKFMGKGVDLNSVVSVKKITEKFGHELGNDTIAEMASHNIEGLADAFRFFDLDSIRKFLNQDMSLPTAVVILNNTKRFGYKLTIDQIANIAENVHDREDFLAALHVMPLREVEKMFTVGVSYDDYRAVKSALERNSHKLNFDSSLAIAKKFVDNYRHGDLSHASQILDFYNPKEIDKIIAKGIALDKALNVKLVSKEKELDLGLTEILEFSKGESDIYGTDFGEAIDAFGIGGVKKIASKNCSFGKAVEVNDYINGSGSGGNMPDELRASLKKGGLDVIIAVAKDGNIESATKTIEIGFTVEEITRFPYLISSLVTKE